MASPPHRIIKAMPAVNVFFSNQSHLPQLEALAPDLRDFIAEQLSCGDRSLVLGHSMEDEPKLPSLPPPPQQP